MVVRADLAPATQAVQAVHAALDFSVAHPGLLAAWHSDSNHLAVLTVPNLDTLQVLCWDAEDRGLLVVEFREPDLGNELTAAAFEPAAQRFLSSLPLALRGGE